MDILIWVFIAVIFTIFELVTGTFILIWFAVGSCVTPMIVVLPFIFFLHSKQGSYVKSESFILQ